MNCQENSVAVLGLARNCGSEAAKSIDNIIAVLHKLSLTISFCVVTNDNSDGTGDILSGFQKNYNFFNVIQLDGLTSSVPNRIDRLAFARNLGLASLRLRKKNFKYLIVVDLDGVAATITVAGVNKALEKLEKGKVVGVFPASKPFYYDLYALRAERWLMFDIIWVYRAFRVLLPFVPRHRLFRFICARFQCRLEDMAEITPVTSAFGGFGIYSWQAIDGVWYNSRNSLGFVKCEHVLFNEKLKGSLIILKDLHCVAPVEHI